MNTCFIVGLGAVEDSAPPRACVLTGQHALAANHSRCLLAASIAFRLDLAIRGGSVTGYVGRTLEGPVNPGDLLRAGLNADPGGLALISGDTRWTCLRGVRGAAI